MRYVSCSGIGGTPIDNWLRTSLAVMALALNTALHVPVLLCVALVKVVLPSAGIRKALNHALMAIAESWIAVNSSLIRALTRIDFVVTVDASLHSDGHYLVLANHQSWVDIPVLQLILNRRIPLLRFFLKQQLIWVPLLGLAWWALDFPFMKRYSREVLARHPQLAGRDVEATRRACEKFRNIPVSIMNFVEGTRFTPAKHQQQDSPFSHLLKPRAGGVAFVLSAMGETLHAILDVTIAYPQARPGMADLFGDRIPAVHVHLRELPIPPDLLAGDYQNDAVYRDRFQAWINTLWEQKDARLATLVAAAPAVAGNPRPVAPVNASSNKRCS